MSMKERSIQNGGAVVLAVVMLAAIGMYVYSTQRNHITESKNQLDGVVHSAYIADFDDDRVLVGYAQNVFVGKVIQYTGSAPRNGVPHKQLEVSVVHNIKGEAQGVVTVDVENSSEVEELIPGATYLLAARHIPTISPFYHIGAHPAFRSNISRDAGLTPQDLAELAKKDERVRHLLEAYPNEVLRDRDIEKGYTLNAFKTLSEEQRQAVYNAIAGQ